MYKYPRAAALTETGLDVPLPDDAATLGQGAPPDLVPLSWGFQDKKKPVTGITVGMRKSVRGISVGVFMLASVKEFRSASVGTDQNLLRGTR